MNPNEEMKLTYSSLVVKDGKPYVSVRFERGDDFAEGGLPDCDISFAKGFTQEEIDMLQDYLRAHRKEIGEKAKAMSSITNLL